MHSQQHESCSARVTEAMERVARRRARSLRRRSQAREASVSRPAAAPRDRSMSCDITLSVDAVLDDRSSHLRVAGQEIQVCSKCKLTSVLGSR